MGGGALPGPYTHLFYIPTFLPFPYLPFPFPTFPVLFVCSLIPDFVFPSHPSSFPLKAYISPSLLSTSLPMSPFPILPHNPPFFCCYQFPFYPSLPLLNSWVFDFYKPPCRFIYHDSWISLGRGGPLQGGPMGPPPPPPSWLNPSLFNAIPISFSGGQVKEGGCPRPAIFSRGDVPQYALYNCSRLCLENFNFESKTLFSTCQLLTNPNHIPTIPPCKFEITGLSCNFGGFSCRPITFDLQTGNKEVLSCNKRQSWQCCTDRKGKLEGLAQTCPECALCKVAAAIVQFFRRDPELFIFLHYRDKFF